MKIDKKDGHVIFESKEEAYTHALWIVKLKVGDFILFHENAEKVHKVMFFENDFTEAGLKAVLVKDVKDSSNGEEPYSIVSASWTYFLPL